jgi:fatty-acyl-CoA synthase
VTSETTYVDRVLARALAEPDAELLRDPHQALTAGQFGALVAQLARALDARGLRKGDRVALLVVNSATAIAARYAAAALGCVTVFCPNRGPAELAAFLDVVDPTLVIAFPATVEHVRGLRFPVATLGPDDLLADAAEQSAAPFTSRARPDDLATLATSGGTTGAQKATLRTFTQQLGMVDAGPMPERRQLVCMPLAYVSQVHTDQTLLAGGSVVLLERFDPVAILETIAAQRITHLGLIEPGLVELIDHPQLHEHDLSSLRALAHIGANAPASLRRRLLERLGRPLLIHPYGASELGIVSLLTPPDYTLDHPERLSTAGRPLPGIEVRIVDPTGAEVPAGTEGLIVARTPGQAEGYAGTDGAGEFTDGDVHTSDLGHLAPDGFLHIHGRATDTRVIDGQTVLPLDIEDTLCAIPGVRYAVALPDRPFTAAILLAPGAEIDTATLLGPTLSRVVVVDRMPVTEQGKPDRTAIWALVGEE